MLNFTKLPRNLALCTVFSTNKLNLISCCVAASVAIALHNDHSYFIHHESCFNLSKKNFHLKDINAIINFPCYSCHLQFSQKVFVLVRTVEIMPPLCLKQLPNFSQACHFVHQNMGHLVRLQVYNCSCFQLNRPGFAARSHLSWCPHHQLMHFLWNSPVTRRDLAQSASKKNSSAPPGQIVPFNVVFPLYIYIFMGWDALAKARRGKEKNLSKKRTLTGRHLGP